MGYPQMDGLWRKLPLEMDDLGGTPISGNLHIIIKLRAAWTPQSASDSAEDLSKWPAPSATAPDLIRMCLWPTMGIPPK